MSSKEDDAVITAAEALIGYQTSGARELYRCWDEYFVALEDALKARAVERLAAVSSSASPYDADRVGQSVLDAIISGRLVRVDPESARLYGAGTTDGVIFIWAANAPEQIGRTAEAAVRHDRVIEPRAAAPELLEAIDDLLDVVYSQCSGYVEGSDSPGGKALARARRVSRILGGSEA